jgi:hypothetical protein
MKTKPLFRGFVFGSCHTGDRAAQSLEASAAAFMLRATRLRAMPETEMAPLIDRPGLGSKCARLRISGLLSDFSYTPDGQLLKAICD